MRRTLLGVWRPGTGAQHWETGMSLDELEQKDAELFKKGMRLADVVVETLSSGKTDCTAVWRPGTGPQHWATGMSIDEFKNKDTDFFQKGFHLDVLNRRNGYTAVWRPGTGVQHWASGLDVDEFKKKDDEFFAGGFRLAIVDKYNDGDSFLGVWRPGTGEQRWWTGAFDNFKDVDTSHFNNGLRLVALNHSYGMMAAWRPGSGAQFWQIALQDQNSDEFKTVDQAHFDKGRRLVHIGVGFAP
jgi:Bacterial tandem repeat domain 1